MRVLLDENIPHEFRHSLRKEMPEHDFNTARYAKLTGDRPEFTGLNSVDKDKKLIELAPQRGFDVVLVTEKGIQNQQDIANLPINIIFINVSNITPALESKLPEIKAELVEVEKSIALREKPQFRTITGEPELTTDSTSAQPQPARKSLSADFQRGDDQPDQSKTKDPQAGQDKGRKSLSNDFNRSNLGDDRSDR